VRTRLLSVSLAACLFAATGPALAVDSGSDASHAGGDAGHEGRSSSPRNLDPEHSSGGAKGPIAGDAPRWARRTPTQTSRVSWQVAPGVTFTRWSQTDARGPITAHLLTVDPSKPGVRIDYASMGQVRRTAPVRDIIAVDHAVAGVNGDFYDIGHTGAPLGLGKDRQRGLLHAREEGWNSAFFINRRGRARIGDLPMQARVVGRPDMEITNLNSPFVRPGGIGVYTPRWGRTAGYRVTQGQRKAVRAVTVVNGRVRTNKGKLSTDQPIKGQLLIGRGPGAEVLRKLDKGTRLKLRWTLHNQPQMAISGNHFLVHEGIIRAVDDRQMHPRTAVGVDYDTGEVLLLVIDGRQDDSRGYTMVELANLMIDLGADEAVNLDGGGSSTMVAKNRKGNMAVLNDPSDGFQRWVANAVEVTYSPPS